MYVKRSTCLYPIISLKLLESEAENNITHAHAHTEFYSLSFQVIRCVRVGFIYVLSEAPPGKLQRFV
jgi:hypothetical protein